jgi:hypothetical protein
MKTNEQDILLMKNKVTRDL